MPRTISKKKRMHTKSMYKKYCCMKPVKKTNAKTKAKTKTKKLKTLRKKKKKEIKKIKTINKQINKIK